MHAHFAHRRKLKRIELLQATGFQLYSLHLHELAKLRDLKCCAKSSILDSRAFTRKQCASMVPRF